jgi:hypothetical protein
MKPGNGIAIPARWRELTSDRAGTIAEECRKRMRSAEDIKADFTGPRFIFFACLKVTPPQRGIVQCATVAIAGLINNYR